MKKRFPISISFAAGFLNFIASMVLVFIGVAIAWDNNPEVILGMLLISAAFNLRITG